MQEKVECVHAVQKDKQGRIRSTSLDCDVCMDREPPGQSLNKRRLVAVCMCRGSCGAPPGS